MTELNKDRKNTVGSVNQRKKIDHPDHSILQVSKNTEKSPGDLRTFAINQTRAKKLQREK